MRKHYLDNIRWITVVLVVIYHVVFMFNGVTTELVVGPFHPFQPQDALQYLLYPWFMILLFVVAGASSRYALQRQSPRSFLAARTRKLLVPSTIGLVVFHWIGGYINMQVTHAEGLPPEIPGLIRHLILSVSGTSVLWFIQMLWIYSVLLLLVHKWESGKLYERAKSCSIPVLLLLAVPLWLSAQVLNTPVIAVYRFGIYGTAFFLGYFIFAHESVIERLSKLWLPLSAGALVMGIGYTIFYFGENYAAAPVVNSPFSVAYGWIAVLAVFAVMKKFGDRTSPFAGWMAQRSFGLYVLHYTPLSAAALWICKENSLPAVLSYVITGAAAFLGSWLLYEIISRIPIVRWCVLGIRKKVRKDVL